MEEAFEKLRKGGKTSVEDIIQWMKESKMIEHTLESEASARKLFEGVKDVSNIDRSKFLEAMAVFAVQRNTSVDHLSRMLSGEAPKLFQAAQSGLSAFKDATKK